MALPAEAVLVVDVAVDIAEPQVQRRPWRAGPGRTSGVRAVGSASALLSPRHGAAN